MSVEFVAHPRAEMRVGDFLTKELASGRWKEFLAAVAFVKRSGTKHLKAPLAAFCANGGTARLSAGIDAGGTSIEGLTDLLEAVAAAGGVFVYKNAGSSTFHPKIYVFRNEVAAEVVVGSCNMTEGGLFTNYEASFVVSLDLGVPEQAELFNRITQSLDEWSTPSEGLCYKLDAELLARLAESGLVPDEARARAEEKRDSGGRGDDGAGLFKRHAVPAAPKVAKAAAAEEPPGEEGAPGEELPAAGDPDVEEGLVVLDPSPVDPQEGKYKVFLMTLQQTDVGVGQTTAGKARRSPEIFIPLKARNQDPEFWGWPDAFVPDPDWTGAIDKNGYGKMDRTDVMVRLGGDTFPIHIWYNPDKKDQRLRSEHMRSAGSIGDILYVERGDGTGGFQYYVEVVPQGSARHAELLALCTESVQNSKKKFGYY